jgi:hypothetical protein
MATLIEIAKAAQAGGEDSGDLCVEATGLIKERVLVGVKERGEVAIDSIGTKGRKVLMKAIPCRR